jgi:SH3-like domain-containing protein
LAAAVFMRAVRDALGVDWRPVAPEDVRSARDFLRSPWAADLAWALGLDAAALAGAVERAMADPAVMESLRAAAGRFCARGARRA